MLNVFEAILSFLETAVMWVVNLTEGLYNMIILVGKSVGMVSNTVAFLPSELIVFATAVISVCVVYLIIGR